MAEPREQWEAKEREAMAALVQRSQAGDLDAFGVLVTGSEDQITALVALILGPSAEWSEVQAAAVEVFTRAWRDLRRLRNPGEFTDWLRRQAVRTAMRQPSAAKPDQLDTLPKVLRAVLRLHFTGGYSTAEIARLFGCPECEIWARLYEGCRRLPPSRIEPTERGQRNTQCTGPG